MNKINRIVTFVVFSLALLFSWSSFVYAADCPPNATTKEAIKCGTTKTSGAPITDNPEKSINDTISEVINLLSVAIGIIATIMVVIGGFKYITSNGDTNKTASAKNTIVYALIGLAIVVISQIIVQFVLTTTTKNINP